VGEQALGQREVVRLQMTTLTGPSLYRDGFNLQPHQTLERVVLPAEIQKLPALEGYLCIAGYDRARVALQWAEAEEIGSGICPSRRFSGRQSGTIRKRSNRERTAEK
jgi:Type IV secretion-system coupling protein DNA-binding domain